MGNTDFDSTPACISLSLESKTVHCAALLHVLSVDLDWFNGGSDLHSAFAMLRGLLKVGSRYSTPIVIVEEHHYLMPVAKVMLKFTGARTLRITNIDYHHDLYFLDTINFSSVGEVTPGNFLAHMLFDESLCSYCWVPSLGCDLKCCLKDLKMNIKKIRNSEFARMVKSVDINSKPVKCIYDRIDLIVVSLSRGLTYNYRKVRGMFFEEVLGIAAESVNYVRRRRSFKIHEISELCRQIDPIVGSAVTYAEDSKKV